jgi:hypothetical protein
MDFSVSKNRQLGWHGFVDSADGIFDSIREMADMKMVPKPVRINNFEIKYYGYGEVVRIS